MRVDPPVVHEVVTRITEGFTALASATTEMLKIDIVAGCLGVALACFVGKKAIRLIKSR